ncbi:MAG: Lrp/AsnC family transcriptional regulator [Candidatus Odinarchaeota archaeon]
MITAFVLIKVVVGSEDIVVDNLKVLPGVEEVHFTYGDYDVICKIKTENMTIMKEFILEKIRKMDFIVTTATLIVM